MTNLPSADTGRTGAAPPDPAATRHAPDRRGAGWRAAEHRQLRLSDALAAGLSVFELSRIMGTSVRMIERHYGALLDGAAAGVAGRLDALDAERDQTASDAETV